MLVILSFLGIFIAGTLTAFKLLNIVPPCGLQSDCAQLANHPTAFWLGIPVAYFGLGAYFFFAVISVAWHLQGASFDPWLKKIFVASAGFGTVVSLWLQYVSLVQIQVPCYWCMASAATMIGLLVFSVLALLKSTEPSVAKIDGFLSPAVGLLSVLAIAATVGFTVATGAGNKSGVLSVEKEVELVPAKANIYGNASAPITVVEFADLCCVSCRRASPKIKEFVDGSNGKVRIVFRHFPLPMHPMAPPAAFVAEIAAETGKFWPFIDEFVKGEKVPERIEEVLEIAERAGLPMADVEKRLANPSTDPALKRVYDDKIAAEQLRLQIAPSFIILMEGKPTLTAGPDSVFKILTSSPYKEIIEGK